MFFQGVFINGKSAVIVGIKKFQKNVKKHYLLFDVQKQETSSLSQNIVDDISTFYKKSEFMIKKRIYSQDGRPTKTVFAPPGVIIGFYDDAVFELVEQVRKKNIRTEAVMISRDDENLRKEEYNRGLGRNFYLHENELIKKLAVVMAQNRFIVDSERMNSDAHLQLISTWTEKEIRQIEQAGNLDRSVNMDILIALSLPIWFRETIRYARAYSA